MVEHGLLSAEQMEAALRRGAESDGRLDTAMLELGLVSEPGLLQALADVSGLRPVNLADFEPNREMALLIPAKIAERLGAVPLSMEGEALHLACAYPVPTQSLDEVSFLLGKRLELWVALECRVRDWLSLLYQLPLPRRYEALLAALDPHRSPQPAAPVPAAELKARQGPLVETTTLEDALFREVELLSEAEAIPLAVKKAPRAEEALPVKPAPPPPPPEPEGSVPDWTLEQARAALREATGDRDRILEVALRYARGTFEFVAAFAVLKGAAVGWDARGHGADRRRLQELSIPLDAASVFRTVALTRGSYVGPLPPDSLSAHFLQQLGRAPRTVFLHPVEVRSRLLAILYADSGQKPISQRKLSGLILFCQELPGAFQELLLSRKRMAALPSAEGGAAPPPSLGWSPATGEASASHGRAASLPGLATSEEARPPPDFAPLLSGLTGPDAARRARAIAELARTPEASARELAQAFPGPTAWSRLPVVELPEAEELGPIPGALGRLGRAGAQALAPLLDVDDAEIRYFALLTAGSLPYAELVDGVLRGLFDLEPDISSAARAASTAFKRLPRFDSAMKDLRQELASRDPLRRSLAARALGVLHDRESVEGLIGLTGSDDEMVAHAAAEALREITKMTHGTNPRAWTAWWAENRVKRRADWLLAALLHSDLDVRLSAIEELARAFNDNLGYFADGPKQERNAAARKWEATLVRAQKGQLEL